MELPSAATGFVPFEMAQIMPKEFVPTELAQIPSVLFFTGWSNHQLILNRCKSDDERLFYILFAQKEHLQNKQLVSIRCADCASKPSSGQRSKSKESVKRPIRAHR